MTLCTESYSVLTCNDLLDATVTRCRSEVDICCSSTVCWSHSGTFLTPCETYSRAAIKPQHSVSQSLLADL